MPVPGIVLTPRDGTRWRFDPGALFLEFLLTGGPDDLAAFDQLRDPEDLCRWIDACRLDLSGADVALTRSDLEAARRLRDALWRATRAVILSAAVADDDRAVANRAAGAPPLTPVWTTHGRVGFSTPTVASAVLSTVARDAIAVLTGHGPERLRECAADDCRLVFLDTSRPGGRRWCSMQRCGNRHKVRDHRARHTTRTEGEELD